MSNDTDLTTRIQEPSTLDSLHPSQTSWLFQGLQQLSSISTLLDDLDQGTAIAASDGSFDKNTSITTSGWIIESEDGKEFISGMSFPAFNSVCNGAYRGEIAGLLAITHMATYLAVKHGMNKATLTVGCNNI